jgi:hypothetical protein
MAKASWRAAPTLRNVGGELALGAATWPVPMTCCPPGTHQLTRHVAGVATSSMHGQAGAGAALQPGDDRFADPDQPVAAGAIVLIEREPDGDLTHHHLAEFEPDPPGRQAARSRRSRRRARRQPPVSRLAARTSGPSACTQRSARSDA